MLEAAWLFIGAIALLASLIAVLTNDNAIAVVAGVVGFLAWLLWSFGAYGGVETGSGEVFQMWPVALFGTALSFVPGAIALTGPVEIIGSAGEKAAEDF